MATLILQAGTSAPISVTCQRAGKASPRFVGSKSLSFSGRERTSIRGQAKVIPIVASYVSTADEAAIQAAVMNGVQIPCSGDILGNLQTLCSISDVTSNMVPGLVDFWEMSFTLSEVNASVILLRYAPGDTITGESFTRSTIGTYFNAVGLLVDAAINVKRDGHYGPYDAADRTKRMLLLEDTRTNLALWSSDQSNAAWTKATCTIATGVPGMRSATSACTLTATGIHALCYQSTAGGASVVVTNSSWIRRRTGTGTVQMVLASGAGASRSAPLAITTNWQRFSAVGVADTSRYIGFDIATSGDAIDVENAQMEVGPFASSEIQTTTVAVTRGADSYSLPFAYPPQEMTAYEKYVEGGTLYTGTSSGVFGVGASGNPSIFLYNNGGLLTLEHRQGAVGFAVSNAGAAPALGQVDEVRALLFGDGSVQLGQSIAAATEVNAAQSVAQTLLSAWSDQLFTLNSRGGGTSGFTALQSLKVVAGARSLAEMRAA